MSRADQSERLAKALHGAQWDGVLFTVGGESFTADDLDWVLVELQDAKLTGGAVRQIADMDLARAAEQEKFLQAKINRVTKLVKDKDTVWASDVRKALLA